MTSVPPPYNFSQVSCDTLRQQYATFAEKYSEICATIMNIDTDTTAATWDTIIQPKLNIEMEHVELIGLIKYMHKLHPDKNIRDTSSELYAQYNNLIIEYAMNAQLSRNTLNYITSAQHDPSLTTEQQQFLQKEKSNITKNFGSSLSQSQSSTKNAESIESIESIKTLKKEISALEASFNDNTQNQNIQQYFTMTSDQLTGCPDSVLRTTIQDNGTYKISYNHTFTILEKCTNRATRKETYIRYQSRATDNNEILKQILHKRHALATALNHKNFADYKSQDTILKSHTEILSVLDDLAAKSAPLIQQNLKALLDIAKNDNIDKIEIYDINYYMAKYNGSTIGVNIGNVSEYLNMDTIIAGTISIYSTLFSFEFIDETTAYGRLLWGDDVRVFRLMKNGTFVGYMYIDLYAREGKFQHVATLPFVRKSVNYPQIILNFNFAKDGKNITFDQCVNFFHEFGHAIHEFSSIATIEHVSGLNCERDFVEVPSQMFEEWCYCPEVMKILAPDLPQEIIDGLRQISTAMQGITIGRQLSYSITDILLHTTTNCDPRSTFMTTYKQIMNMSIPENTDPLSTFIYLTHGYESYYYNYITSKIYAVDLYTTRFLGNELNNAVGNEFIEKVLKHGYIKNAITCMTDFMNSAPSTDAYIRRLMPTNNA